MWGGGQERETAKSQLLHSGTFADASGAVAVPLHLKNSGFGESQECSACNFPDNGRRNAVSERSTESADSRPAARNR